MPASTPTTRTLLVNSVVAAVLGSTLMVLVHELAHFFTGVALGHRSTLFAFGVSQVGAGVRDQAIIALAGPAFSLVSGLVLVAWTPLRRAAGFGHLLWLWFAFTSLQEGVTYLCLTPFGAGDTGSTAVLLDLPWWSRVLAGLVGVAGLFGVARLFAPWMARHAGSDHPRRMALTLWTWLIGMGVSVALALAYMATASMDVPAGDQIAVAAAGTSTLVFAPMANLFHRAVATVPEEPLRLRPVPVAGLVALVVMVGVNFALSPGLSLG